MRAALIYQHATSERDKEIAAGMDKRIAKNQDRKPGKKNRRKKRDGPGDAAADSSAEVG